MKNDKSEAAKKKKKNEESEAFDTTRVKIEPGLDSDSAISSRNGDQSSRSGRRRKSEVNDSSKRECSERDQNGVSPTKKRKENKKRNMESVKVKHEFGSSESSPKHCRKELEGDADISGANFGKEQQDGFDLARVKSEPRETPKKSKKHKK